MKPQQPTHAQSGEMPQLGEKRPRLSADLARYGADVAMLFEARDTMKRCKDEHDEARKTIRVCLKTITDVFDMPELMGSKPSSPKE